METDSTPLTTITGHCSNIKYYHNRNKWPGLSSLRQGVDAITLLSFAGIVSSHDTFDGSE